MSSTRNAEDQQIIYKYDSSSWKKKVLTKPTLMNDFILDNGIHL
jgi:hypothetical protein